MDLLVRQLSMQPADLLPFANSSDTHLLAITEHKRDVPHVASA